MRIAKPLIPAIALAGAAALALAGCSSPTQTATGDDTPYQVGIITSQTGALASYGAQYLAGFDAGLAYATNGTGKVGNHPIEVTKADDAGDPQKATSAATDLIGKGVKILAGSAASAIGLALAPVAEQNKVLFISGPAATDAITGANRYTFRSGRQSFQDVLVAKSFLGDPAGKKIVVFAQDSAFGQANVAAVQAVASGATVVPELVDPNAQEFSTFAKKVLDDKPDLVFVAWAGTTAAAMWQALDQQGVLAATTVVTGLADRVTWPALGAVGTKISFLAHYFDGASDTPASQALKTALGAPIDLFNPDGFTAAQMIVHALQASGTDVDAQISALEGWTFDSVKGSYQIRASDHALIQPMYQAKLTADGSVYTATLLKAVPGDQVAPPETPFK
jgi:branched-chain amino acid transport system substrate-binding protein